MTHGTQIINFIRLHIRDDCNKISSIAQVTIVEEKLDSRIVTVAVDVIDAARVEGGGTTDDAMNL